MPAKGLALNYLKFREFSEKGDDSSALLHIYTVQEHDSPNSVRWAVIPHSKG